MASRNLEKMASIDAQLRFLTPRKVSEDDKLVEYDALLLDRFLQLAVRNEELLTWTNLSMERSVATESIKSGSSAALCSEATIEIKIKAPDSQTYTMRVDNCMPVNALMDQLTTITGILPEEQRLICRGRRIQDHHLLSHYHLEDGQTLHLVVRQPEFYNISPVLKISERMDPLSLAKVVASRGVNGSKIGGVTRRVGGDGSSLAPPKKKARSGTCLRDKVSSGPSKNISAGVVTEEINNAFTSNVVETDSSSKSKGKGVVEEVAADVVVVHSGTTKDKGKDVAVGKRLSMLLRDLKNAERSVNEIAKANDEIEKEKKALIEEVDNLRNAKSALEAELSQNIKDLVSANSVKDFLSAKLDKVKEDAKKKSEEDAAEIKRMKFANTMYRDHVCSNNMYRDHVYKFVNSESCKTYVTHKCATSFSIGYETCGKFVGEGNVFETSKNGLDPFLKWVNDNPEAVKELLADPEPEVWNPTLEIPVDEVMRLDGTTSDSEDDDEVEEDAEDNAEAGTGTEVSQAASP